MVWWKYEPWKHRLKAPVPLVEPHWKMNGLLRVVTRLWSLASGAGTGTIPAQLRQSGRTKGLAPNRLAFE